jgi:hypothetical protein
MKGGLAVMAGVLAILPSSEAFLAPGFSLARSQHHNVNTRGPRAWGVGSHPQLALAPSRTTLRAGSTSLRMSGDLGAVKQHIAQAISSNTAGADPADVEEMLAILTTATRSYERKLAKSGGSVQVPDLLQQLGQRYVDDEGLLTAPQWSAVSQAVTAATSGGGGGGGPLFCRSGFSCPFLPSHLQPPAVANALPPHAAIICAHGWTLSSP